MTDVLPAGWHSTSASGGASVTLPSQGASSVALGAAQDATGSISGFVFNDLTNNGIFNAGDQGLSGWTVFIDANNNGNLDSGETSTVSVANGVFHVQ